MAEGHYVYKNARRIDRCGRTIWKCLCGFSKACCTYSTKQSYTKEQYEFCCPNFIGVEEKGLMCAIPNSVVFILEE